MTIPTAGWYDDPDDDTVRRWWDGRDWTDHTRPRAEDIAPGWYADPRDAALQRWWDGAGWSESTRPAALATAPPPSTPAAQAPPPTGLTPAAVVAAPVASAEPVSPEPVSTEPTPTEAASAVPAVAPGWYPDPAEPSRTRWWTGLAWGEATPPVAVPLAAAAAAPASDPVGPAPTGTTHERSGGRAAHAPRRSLRRALVAVAVVVALLAAGGLALRSRLQQSQLAEPAATAAEKEWALAGASLGGTLAGRGVKDDQVETVCAGAYELLAASAVPAELQGVAPDRARALYLSSCAKARRAPATAPSDASPTSARPSA